MKNMTKSNNPNPKDILLGEIVSASGIRGEVRIKTYTDNPLDISKYGPLHDHAGTEYELANLRIKTPYLVTASIKGVQDRNTAESKKGIKLYVNRDCLPQTEEDEYYHEDLMGLAIVDEDGTNYGVVIQLHNFGAGEFFDIKTE
jgi:16S rRNA processing protein RimM